MKALWQGKIIADSADTVSVEGNQYFSSESVNHGYLRKSGDTYQCWWKGAADYYDVVIEDKICHNCAWMYPEPTEPAKMIKGRFAFWQGVEVVK